VIFYCLITAVINTVASIVLGSLAVMRRRTGGPNLEFGLFVASGALWSGSYALWLLSSEPESAVFWTKVLSAAAIFVPATYFYFVVNLLGLRRRRMIRAGYGLALVFSVLSIASDMIVREVAPIGGFPFWPRAGVLYPLYLVFFFSYPLVSWIELYRAMRRAAHARRNQLKYILFATTLGFIGGAFNFPYWYELPIPPVGNGLIVLYLAGVTYAIVGLRLLEVNYVITKIAAYALIALPLSVIYPVVFGGLLVLTSEPSTVVLAWLLASVPLSYMGVVMIPVLRRRVDGILERTVLRPYLSSRERLQAFLGEISSIKEESQVYRRAAEEVSGALEAFSVFYVRGEFESDLPIRAARLVPRGLLLPETMSHESPIVRLLASRHRGVILEELRVTDPQAWEAVREEKERLQFEVVVPVQADGVLFGFLGMGARARNQFYSDVHLSLLDSVCLQIGLHVRARQIERRANQAEKLISLGTLAAGLAHELRNPLVSIKTFAMLLEENAGDPEFHREFSETVMRDIGRIESIVGNVSAFAADQKVAFSWIRLEEVVQDAYKIARSAFTDGRVEFDFEPAEVPLVHGNHNQLTQVVLNIFNNAVQAIAGREGARVSVRLGVRHSDVFQNAVELRISDNGPGIPPEMVKRIFEPFTTTRDTGDRERKTGLGLGMALAKRTIDGHNGVIRVESELGRGTTFTILLPCGETRT